MSHAELIERLRRLVEKFGPGYVGDALDEVLDICGHSLREQRREHRVGCASSELGYLNQQRMAGVITVHQWERAVDALNMWIGQ